MEEILNLVLTGERLQRLKRFNLISIITAVSEMLTAVPLLFISTPSVHASVSIVLGILVTGFGVMNTVLNSVVRSRLCKTLVSEEIFVCATNGDEVSKARKSLSEKLEKLYNRKDETLIAVISIIPVGIYLTASVICAFVNTGIVTQTFIVPLLYAMATVTALIIDLCPAVKNAKYKAELYETADGEITLLKRNAGVAEAVIAKQSYRAKDTATRPQELFLRDPSDRAELRKLASHAGYCTVAFAIALIASLVFLGVMSSNYDVEFMAISSSCLMAVLFFAWVGVAIRVDIRRRAIYRRNAAKLTDGEADGIRKFLQEEFLKLNRGGNIFFSVFCGVSTLTGFILGAASAVNDPEISFIENASGIAVAFFLASAVVALIIWTVVYVLYRKKVKPAELRLCGMTENYGR